MSTLEHVKYPTELVKLITFLKKWPGVGSKTAERFAFHLLNWPKEELSQLSQLLGSLQEKIHHCPECGCVKDDSKCLFCLPERDARYLCIIASPKDAFSMEETRSYRGFYHVLGTLLSPIEGKYPEHLPIDRLKKRITALQPEEVIIALDPTVEGDATALFLKEQLSAFSLRLTRLALGLPMGSTLEYIDEGTLARALSGRQFL